MNIIHIKFTNLANAPDDLNSSIKQYAIKYPNRKITTSLVFEMNPKESYKKVVSSLQLGKLNILHFHNLSYNIDPRLYQVYKIKQIIQYHSEPIGNKAMLSSPISNKFVIAQYHMTLQEYKNCKVVRNLIDMTRPAYNYEYSIKDDIVRVGFSPSVLDRRNHYYDKGAQETFNIFQRLKEKYPTKFDFDLIHNVEYNECLMRKAKCDIIIDECKTGSYHRSGLEGLALGKVTICKLSDELVKKFKEVYGYEIPFINVDITKLMVTLENLINIPKIILFNKGKSNREWFIKNWSEEKVVEEFLEAYQNST